MDNLVLISLALRFFVTEARDLKAFFLVLLYPHFGSLSQEILQKCWSFQSSFNS